MRTDYTIVIPTLDRPENMSRMLAMFPTAIVTVNDTHAGPYRGIVSAKQLLIHPPLRLIETRNWILDNIQTEAVIQVNDDVLKLVSLGVKSRTWRDPAVIRGVIENTLQCSRDLGIGVFCWSLTSNAGMLHPDVRPIRPNAPCSAHAFGVCGRARSRRFDTQFRGCGDVDYTLNTLLHDRSLLCDVRWHFGCGGMSRGKGGQTGELAPHEQESGQLSVRRKWGRYVGSSAVQAIGKKATWRSFAIRVQRQSPLGRK